MSWLALATADRTWPHISTVKAQPLVAAHGPPDTVTVHSHSEDKSAASERWTHTRITQIDDHGHRRAHDRTLMQHRSRRVVVCFSHCSCPDLSRAGGGHSPRKESNACRLSSHESETYPMKLRLHAPSALTSPLCAVGQTRWCNCSHGRQVPPHGRQVPPRSGSSVLLPSPGIPAAGSSPPAWIVYLLAAALP